MPMKAVGHSLSFVKFKRSLESEIRAFSQAYSRLARILGRWLGALAPPPPRLSGFPR